MSAHGLGLDSNLTNTAVDRSWWNPSFYRSDKNWTIGARYGELFILTRWEKKDGLRAGRCLKRVLYHVTAVCSLTFLNDSSGWLSIRNLSRWSGGNWPALLVLRRLALGCGRRYIARLHYNGSYDAKFDVMNLSSVPTRSKKSIASIERAYPSVERSCSTFFLILNSSSCNSIDFFFCRDYLRN